MLEVSLSFINGSNAACISVFESEYALKSTNLLNPGPAFFLKSFAGCIAVYAVFILGPLRFANPPLGKNLALSIANNCGDVSANPGVIANNIRDSKDLKSFVT